MLISEIKNKEVRERAEFYAKKYPWVRGRDINLDEAFVWSETVEGARFWVEVDDGEDISLPPTVPTVPAKLDMPRLPVGWRYTGEYRQPAACEYYFFCGEVKHCNGRTAGWYPIVRYVGVES